MLIDKETAAEKAAQKREHLLFHGLIRLWLRNSGFALKQSRHRGEFRLVKLRKRSLCFATAVPAAVFLSRPIDGDNIV